MDLPYTNNTSTGYNVTGPGGNNTSTFSIQELLHLLQTVCRQQHQQVTVEEGVRYCNSSYDSVICWPTTRVDTSATVSCPAEFEGLILNPEATTTKYCFPNGTWDKANYSLCLPVTTAYQDGDLHNFIIRVIFWVGYSSSTVMLLLALMVFGYFRSLHCLRNYIHCHLMVTFTLRNILWIVMHYSLLTFSNMITEDPSRAAIAWICQLMVACYNYLQSASFFWMLVEGLYLHTMIVWAYSADKVKMWKYALLGWGGPFVIIFAWGTVKGLLDNKNCWLPQTNNNYDYIYIAPVLLILLINVIFLASIEYVLIMKLKSPNSIATRQYKKAVKGTVILFPLLGVIYVLMITPPGSNPISQKVFTYFNAILQSVQGLLVAVFYCFLNAEVRHTITNRVSRWKDTRSVHTNYSRHSRASIVHRATECTSMLLKATTEPAYHNRETGEDEISFKKDKIIRSRPGTRCSRLSSLNSNSDTSYLAADLAANKNTSVKVPYKNGTNQLPEDDYCIEKHPIVLSEHSSNEVINVT